MDVRRSPSAPAPGADHVHLGPFAGRVVPGMRVRYAEFAASPRAAHLIEGCWAFDSGGRPGELSPVQQCVPMGTVEIILMVRGRSHGLFDDRWVLFPRKLLVGIMREPVRWNMTGDSLMFGARVRPEAALRLFGRSLKDLVNTHAPADALLGPAWSSGLDRVLSSDGPEAMVSAMEELLLEREAAAALPTTRFTTALQLMRTAGSRFDPDVLTDRLFVGDRQVQRLFKENLGLSAASYHRIIRFRRAFDAATTALELRWTDLAHDLGYADQAHFIRDFKTFCGYTPGMLQEGRVPSFLLRGRLAPSALAT